MATPLVIAHRGASAEAPENTLAAFRRALARGVDGIELDVQTTRDGVPVVFHDDSLRRLTGQRGRLAAKTARQIKRLRVHGREPIPHLATVLALTRRKVVVQIELKRGVRVAPVIRAVRRARAAAWVVFASFDPRLLRAVARLAPEIPRMLIAAGRGGTPHFLQRMAAAGASGLSLGFSSVRNQKWVREIHLRGATLWCWTVNRPADFRRLARWGVDGILTDNPALLPGGI